jgi:polyisoprenoid-binding protein YceI
MRLAWLAGVFLAVASSATAQPWSVDAAKSRIGFTAMWLGKPVSGHFRRWSAAIDFDPANLASAKIIVDIDTRSAVTGDATVDGALPGDDWFNSAVDTRARFVSNTVVPGASAGRYLARGVVTIRGKTHVVGLDFSLATNGDMAVANGSALLDRRWFGLGVTSDATSEYVAFAVPITVAISARKAR